MVMMIIIYGSACSPSHWNCVVPMENIFGIKADTSLQWKIRQQDLQHQLGNESEDILFGDIEVRLVADPVC